VSEFLVEVYVPRGKTAIAPPGAAEVSRTAEELTEDGKNVALVSTVLVPEEETCFFFFQAQSIDAVREAAGRAGLRPERVVEVVSERVTPRQKGE
jgi:hypothetical protein